MRRLTLAALPFILIACNSSTDALADKSADASDSKAITLVDQKPFTVTEIATFNEPWAMTFLPGGPLQALITEKGGTLKLWEYEGEVADVSGVPEVDYGGQGGLGDVILHPDFANNKMIYLSYAEAGDGGTRGAVVASAILGNDDKGPALTDVKTIWTQFPKVKGRGHYGHRMTLSPDGKYLFISSGERQKFDPSQDMSSNMGKVLRLNPDGTTPTDNPFAEKGGVTAQIWSLGHRNPLGIAFDGNGQLWNSEMGPKHGDELNMVKRAANYGYPIVSNGDHYDGKEIPDHDTRPEFEAPAVYWDPTIAPSGLIFYSGDKFPAWKGSAFIGGLASTALIRVSFSGEGAKEAERFTMDNRIREVEQGPAGSLWLLEDGEGGRLLRLDPPS